VESPDGVATCLALGFALIGRSREGWRWPVAQFERWVQQCQDFALPMVQRLDDLVTHVAQLPEPRPIEVQELRELVVTLREALWQLVFTPLRVWRFAVAVVA